MTDIVVPLIPRAEGVALLENEPKVTLAVLMTVTQRLREAQSSHPALRSDALAVGRALVERLACREHRDVLRDPALACLGLLGRLHAVQDRVAVLAAEFGERVGEAGRRRAPLRGRRALRR